MAHVPDVFASAAALDAAQTVLITGGTGFIGTRLTEALTAAGHRVIVLSRKGGASGGKALTVRSLDEIAADARIDAIVNLAGEPIADGLWTQSKRERIIESRRSVAEACRQLIARLHTPPQVFVTASAIGWYGIRDDEVLDETSAPADCFSHQVCVVVEAGADRIAEQGVRAVKLRVGLVLDAGGGLLGRMLLPFRLGLGGPFGNGQHWMSWIHRDDLVRMILHAIGDQSIAGPLNGTAPTPVRNRDFTAALGKALRRPAIIPVPAWPLRRLLGQFAEELLLGGQRVIPAQAEQAGFAFLYPELGQALRRILR